MPLLGRVIAGRKAKMNGRSFENFLKDWAYRQKFDVTHLPPCGGRYLSKTNFVSMNIPFDFIFTKDGKAIFCDAKKTDKKSFSRSQIDMSQILSLLGKEHTGHTSGYIVHFKTENKVSFFMATLLWNLKRNESLIPEQGVIIGNNDSIDLDRLLF